MELETVVLETEYVDLGDCKAVYEGYSRAVAAFEEKRSRYRVFLEDLKSRKGDRISNSERQRLDSLAEEAEAAYQALQDMKETISQTLEILFFEGKELEAYLNYHAGRVVETDLINQSVALIEEAAACGGSGDLLQAFELCCRAKRLLSALVADADNQWLRDHEGRAGSMSTD